MAKNIGFNINLAINGQDVVIKCKNGVQDLGKALGTIPSAAGKAGDALKVMGSVSASLQGVYRGIQGLKEVAEQLTAAYGVQEENELKLSTVMGQRMNATTEMIDSIKNLAAEQQKQGVIGDEVQLAGAQQVATFLSQKESIEALLPAMNDLAVQRKGLNVTAEDMVTIGNLVGKVMQGNVGALARVGITFTDAEQRAVKYGDEQQRAAALAQIITNNVGDMNSELAKTDAGKAKQMSNDFGDMQENLGKVLAKYEVFFQGFSQIGMIVTGVGQLTNAVVGLVRAMFAWSGSSVMASLNNRIATAAVRSFTAAVGISSVSIAGATVAVKALTWALRALEVASVIGVVFAAGSAAIDAMGLSAQNTAGQLDDLNKTQEGLADSTDSVKNAYDTTLKSTLADLQEKYGKLKAQWEQLKNEQSKVAWIKENKQAFNELGISVNNVSDAEKIFKDQTGSVVEGFQKRAMAAAYAAKLTELYRKQIDLLDKKRANAKALATDASQTGRSTSGVKAGDEIKDQTYWNSRYGSVGNDGKWRFSAQGAALYTGGSSTGSVVDNKLNADLASVASQINQTQKDMEALNRSIHSTSGGGNSGGSSGGGHTTSRHGGSNGNTGSTDKPLTLIQKPKNKAEYENNSKYYQNKIDNLNANAPDFNEQKKHWEDLKKPIDDVIKKYEDAEKGFETGSLADYQNQISGIDDQLNNLNLSEEKRNELLKERDSLQEKVDSFSIKKGSINDLNNQMQKKQNEYDNATSVEARLKIKADIRDLQKQIDEATNGKVTIPSEVEEDDVTIDKEKSYQNAQTRAQKIQTNFDAKIIDKKEAEKQLKQLNDMLQGLGLDPIKLDLETPDEKKVKELGDELKNNLGGSVSQTAADFGKLAQYMNAGGSASTGAAAGFALVGQQLQQIGGDGPVAKVGATMAAIGQIVLGFASASAQAGSLGPWAWLAFLGAGLAAVATTISTVQSYATGGIIPGNSYSGDKVVAHVNSGEMILNAREQARLFQIATGALQPVVNYPTRALIGNPTVNTSDFSGSGMVSSGKVLFKVKGRDMVAVLANDTRVGRKIGKRSNINIG